MTRSPLDAGAETPLLTITPVILEPLLMLLPEWILWLLVAFVFLSLFGAFTRLILGKGATDQMVGTLAADLVRWMLFAPFKLSRWIYRTMLG